MNTYAIEAIYADQGTIVVFEGWLLSVNPDHEHDDRADGDCTLCRKQDTNTYLIAADHRMAQAIVDDLEDGEPVIVQAESWQIVGTVR